MYVAAGLAVYFGFLALTVFASRPLMRRPGYRRMAVVLLQRPRRQTPAGYFSLP